MYLDYFGLRQKPFLITPDPAFLYPSAGHQQALAHLQYGLNREGGFLLLTGEVGTGKTTLCRLFMDNLPDDFRLAYLLNTKLDSAGVLAGICRELGIELGGERNVNDLVAHIYDNLLAAHAAGKHSLVVIEEAQNLSPDVLETLRLLTNLETSATKLLHILLIGQPELLDTLSLPGLRQLNQRVVSRSHLGALAVDELPPYFRHRLKMAGTERPLFSAAALRHIHRHTGGIPRLVNLLAEHCLMGAYALGKPQVDSPIVRQAARELFATLKQPTPARRWPTLVAATAAMVAVALAVGFYLTGLPAPVQNLLQPPPSSIAATGSVAPETDSPTAIAAEAAPPPAEPTPPQINAFQHLLNHWGIAAEVQTEQALCAAAEAQGLLCIRQAVASAEALRTLKPPLLIRQFNQRDGLDILCLTALDGDHAVLANSDGQQRTPLADVISALDGASLRLWRPPEGYREPLAPGETNPALVAGLIRWLTASGHLDEAPVTGGVYSQYLVDRVERFQADHGLAVDGILGVETLVRLTDYDSETPLAVEH